MGISPTQVRKFTLPELFLQLRGYQRAQGINPDKKKVDQDTIEDWEDEVKRKHHAKGIYTSYPKED